MKALRGKTALVTGAARRIGREIALALACEGANVVVHYNRSAAEAEDVAESIRGHGAGAHTVQGALDAGGGAQKVFERAMEAAGGIDLLVNSAAIFPDSTLAGFTPEELRHNIDVNAYAPLVLMRALADTGVEASVVNLLDCMIADYDKRHVAYHLSKRMLFSLTRMAATEYAPQLRINAVAPGLVLPPKGKDESYLERLANSNPLCRYGPVADVSAAVVFLLRSEFITGQVIYVDGGRHMGGGLYG